MEVCNGTMQVRLFVLPSNPNARRHSYDYVHADRHSYDYGHAVIVATMCSDSSPTRVDIATTMWVSMCEPVCRLSHVVRDGGYNNQFSCTRPVGRQANRLFRLHCAIVGLWLFRFRSQLCRLAIGGLWLSQDYIITFECSVCNVFVDVHRK